MTFSTIFSSLEDAAAGISAFTYDDSPFHPQPCRCIIPLPIFIRMPCHRALTDNKIPQNNSTKGGPFK